MGWGSADREEVVDPDALHDQELARAHLLAMHLCRRLGRHRAALTRLEDIFGPRRSRLDDHRAFETHEAVGDVAMVVPRNALAGGESQYRDAQIGAFGEDLAAGDLVTGAIAILHSVNSSLCCGTVCPGVGQTCRRRNSDIPACRAGGRNAPSSPIPASAP